MMSRKFTMTVWMDSAAFDENETELVHILEEVKDKFLNGYESSVLRDLNGNKVGEFKVTGRKKVR